MHQSYFLKPLRRKQIGAPASKMEVKSLRSVSGSIIYLGIANYPQALMISSVLQQRLPHMNVGNIKEINGVIRVPMRRDRSVTYKNPNQRYDTSRIVVFVDARYPHKGFNRINAVAQEGCIAGIAFGERAGDSFHLLYYFSRKQRRVLDSSSAAETIAAVSGYEAGLMIQDTFYSLLQKRIPITLATDNDGLQKSCSTDSSSRDISTMKDVMKLRIAYEQNDLDKIVWIPGTRNPTDSLTKTLSEHTSAALDSMLNLGQLPIDICNEQNPGKHFKRNVS